MEEISTIELVDSLAQLWSDSNYYDSAEVILKFFESNDLVFEDILELSIYLRDYLHQAYAIWVHDGDHRNVQLLIGAIVNAVIIPIYVMIYF